MSATQDAPPTAPPGRQDGHSRGSRTSRWRIAARLARRQVRRTRLSSLLIAVLVALPIAGMVGYAIIASSLNGTPQEKARVELGEMVAWVSPVGVPDAEFFQAPTEPGWNGYAADPVGAMIEPDGAPIDDPTALLPTGTEAIAVIEGQVRVGTADGATIVRAWAGDTWDPGFAGRFDVIAGERPHNSGEAMVTPASLERLGISLGDEITLTDPRGMFIVVGTVDAATLPDDEAAIFLPDGVPLQGETRWYLPEQSLSWPDVQELNEQGVVAYSRDVVLDPPEQVSADVQNVYDQAQGAMWQLILLLAVAGVFAAYVVVMLAGAAFAVAARRQQRSLAVAASVGASAGDLRRTVLLQGTLLGLVGGTAGLAFGVGFAAVTMRFTADGSATQYWGFHVPWTVLAGILVFAVLVGTASAAVPARTVARSDTLSALRGARRPQKPKTSRPVWGSLILLAGVGLTIASALTMAAVNVADPALVAYDSPLRIIAPFGIVIGPILVQLGILLSGGWLLWLASRGLSRLGLAARLASRDAAAHSSRTVPAFAAIAATVFVAVFALGQISMQNGATARNWNYQAPLHALSVEFHPNTNTPFNVDVATATATSAVDLATQAGAQSTAVIAKQPYPQPPSSSEGADQDTRWVIAVLPERYLLDSTTVSYTWNGYDPSNPISVIASPQLETALGVDLSASQLSAYRSGTALVTDDRFVTDGRIDVAAWTAQNAYDGAVPGNVWVHDPQMPPLAKPLQQESVDAIVIDAPLQPTAIAIAPDAAVELGMITQPARVIADFPEPLQASDLDRIRAQTELRSTRDATMYAAYEQGPPDDVFWMVPILIAVSVLVLGASAVALGLARFERRPDDATLAAVGGTRGLRRRISFWQGLIIAGFGTIAGAVAGVLPPIGFAIQSQGNLLVSDLPWLVVGALAIALPLAIAAVSWLVPPRAPDLTRRTAIA